MAPEGRGRRWPSGHGLGAEGASGAQRAGAVEVVQDGGQAGGEHLVADRARQLGHEESARRWSAPAVGASHRRGQAARRERRLRPRRGSLATRAIGTARNCGCTGTIIARMDSAFYNAAVLGAIRSQGADPETANPGQAAGTVSGKPINGPPLRKRAASVTPARDIGRWIEA